MKGKSKRTKPAKTEMGLVRRRYCLMFGYDVEDEERTGYLGDDLRITEDRTKARRFWSENYDGRKDFGPPEKWLEIVNEDRKLNHGYRFHLMHMREFTPYAGKSE